MSEELKKVLVIGVGHGIGSNDFDSLTYLL